MKPQQSQNTALSEVKSENRPDSVDTRSTGERGSTPTLAKLGQGLVDRSFAVWLTVDAAQITSTFILRRRHDSRWEVPRRPCRGMRKCVLFVLGRCACGFASSRR